MVDMRHRAKLRPDQSNSYGDMTSFSIFFVFFGFPRLPINGEL